MTDNQVVIDRIEVWAENGKMEKIQKIRFGTLALGFLLSASYVSAERPVQEQITISVDTTTTSSVFVGPTTRFGTAGRAQSSSDTAWKPFLGGTEISEEEFYRMTGDIGKAIQVSQSMKEIRATQAVWFPVAIAGLVVELGGGGYAIYGATKNDMTAILGGAIVGGVGALGALVSVAFIKRPPVNWAPAEYAQKLAEAYNKGP